MYRTLLVIVAALLLVAAGCVRQPDQAADWEIEIEGPGASLTISLAQLEEMDQTVLEIRRGDDVDEYRGVILSAVLAQAGITAGSEVTLEGDDGYSAQIDGQAAFSDDTILALEHGGEGLEDKGPVMLVSADSPPMTWVGQLVRIVVE